MVTFSFGEDQFDLAAAIDLVLQNSLEMMTATCEIRMTLDYNSRDSWVFSKNARSPSLSPVAVA